MRIAFCVLSIDFEEGKRDFILKEYFCFTDEMLAEVNAAMAANRAKLKKSKSRVEPKRAKLAKS